MSIDRSFQHGLRLDANQELDGIPIAEENECRIARTPNSVASSNRDIEVIGLFAARKFPVPATGVYRWVLRSAPVPIRGKYVMRFSALSP